MAQNGDILYLFGYSPRIGNQLQKLIPIINIQTTNGSKVSLVLIHDAVIGASSKGTIVDSIRELLELPVSLYVMIADLKARGIMIDHVNKRITPLEYEGLVDLMESTKKIISWM